MKREIFNPAQSFKVQLQVVNPHKDSTVKAASLIEFQSQWPANFSPDMDEAAQAKEE